MGHRVSTPRHDSVHSTAAVATSLAILVAVASATSSTVSASSSASGARGGSISCCGCFVQPHCTPWLPSSAHANSPSPSASTSGTSLPATVSTLSSSFRISCPPPNSRLGRSLRQQSQSSGLLQQLGTKRSHGQRSVGVGVGSDKRKNGAGRRSFDLRYATHGDNDDGLPIFFNNKNKTSAMGHSVEEETNNDAASSIASAESNDVVQRSNPKRGKRARMLRFLDRRFARLQLKSQSNQQSSSSESRYSKSNNSLHSNHDDDRLKYEQRKAEWAAKYTNVSTLRKSFGTNKNRLWGDFDPTTTRKLYHTLLPRALLELKGLRDGLLNTSSEEEDRKKKDQHRKVMIRPRKLEEARSSSSPDTDYLQQELLELAPLAYQARLAAKKYARERSRLPGRIGSMLYDGYRSWRRYGKWSSGGMTWEQVWNKYEDQVLKEAMEELEDVATAEQEETNALLLKWKGGGGLDDEELTARICLRILERSVVTNDAIDRLFLKRLDEAANDEDNSDVSTENVIEERRNVRRRKERQRRRKLQIQADLQAIESKFDDDIRDLLQYSNLTTREAEDRRYKRKRGAFFWKKEPHSGDDVNATMDAGDVVVVEGRYDAAAQGTEKGMAEAAAFARIGDGAKGESVATDETSSSATNASASSALESSDELAATLFSIGNGDDNDLKQDQSLRRLSVHEVFALRILATTKQRISALRALGGGASDDVEAASSADDTAADDSKENKA